MVKNIIPRKIKNLFKSLKSTSNREHGYVDNEILGAMLGVMIVPIAFIPIIVWGLSAADQSSGFNTFPESISKIIIEETKDNPTFTGFGSDDNEIDIAPLVVKTIVDTNCSDWVNAEKGSSVIITSNNCKLTISGDWKEFSVIGQQGTQKETQRTYMATVKGEYVIK
jgi:hypothetical protein